MCSKRCYKPIRYEIPKLHRADVTDKYDTYKWFEYTIHYKFKDYDAIATATVMSINLYKIGYIHYWINDYILCSVTTHCNLFLVYHDRDKLIASFPCGKKYSYEGIDIQVGRN